ncbi:MAG TPA: DUF4850 domain-containing protein [Rhodanobacteraceae bacterium]
MSLWMGILAVAACAIACAGTARADTQKVDWPTVYNLPTTAFVAKISSGGFRVTRATRADLAGKSTHGIPAWWISESVSGQGWSEASGSDAPAVFVTRAPVSVRKRVALFDGNTGWLTVPRGWHVEAGGIGMAGGGNSLVFVAPGGAQHGWITYYDAGVGLGWVFSAADGLFPGAHRRDDEFEGQVTPRMSLSPAPVSLRNPNRCTALLSYRSGNLTVKGVALSNWQHAVDPEFVSFYVALPERDAALQDFLVAAFEALSPVRMAPCRTKGHRREHASAP